MPSRLTAAIVGLSTALSVFVFGVIRPALAATTLPVGPYRLVYRSVAGSDTRQSVFVIVSPGGDPSVATYAQLHWMIERVVTGPATLQWEPSDVKTGPEPLDSAETLKLLASFCEAHAIKLVIIPAG